jgi:hypothetical protein
LFKLFEEAKERARAHFLKNNFFFTNVVIQEEDEQTKEMEEILDKHLVVLHPNGEAFAISLDTDKKTHMLYDEADENRWVKGRIQFKLHGSADWKDPNDIHPKGRSRLEFPAYISLKGSSLCAVFVERL